MAPLWRPYAALDPGDHAVYPSADSPTLCDHVGSEGCRQHGLSKQSGPPDLGEAGELRQSHVFFFIFWRFFVLETL